MGEYTSNYNLYLPEIGETGWGSLVNQNFVKIDQNLPITTNDGSKWFVNNASYNKTSGAWTQIDITKGSGAIHLRNDGYGEALTCVAGNSAITWSAQSLDMKNVYSSTGGINIGENVINGKFKFYALPNVTNPTIHSNTVNVGGGQYGGLNGYIYVVFPKLMDGSKVYVDLVGYGVMHNSRNCSHLYLNIIDKNGVHVSLYSEDLYNSGNPNNGNYVNNKPFNGFHNIVDVTSECTLRVQLVGMVTNYSYTNYATITISGITCLDSENAKCSSSTQITSG